MDIMTLNLRYRNAEDVDNHWNDRRHIIVNILHKYAPWLVGTQEGYKDQLDDLARMVSGYAYLDSQKLISIQRQCPTIFYRIDLLKPERGGNFWLSKTPEIPDTKSWDTAYPRMVTYALFRIKETDQQFYFFNTHFDHKSGWARRESTFLLLRKIKQINPEGFPTILVGDFNMGCRTLEHQLLTGKVHVEGLRGEFHNVWEKCGQRETGAETYHGFTGIPRYEQMDWILATSHFRFLKAERNEDNKDGKYPSDHFPILAKLALPFIVNKKNPERK